MHLHDIFVNVYIFSTHEFSNAWLFMSFFNVFLHSIFFAYCVFECSEIYLTTSFVKVCEPSVGVDNSLKLWYTVWCPCHITQSNPDTASPSLSSHDCLWTEFSCYTVLRFTATLDTPPQIAVYKQWHSVRV
jgi:hypothetical protein